MATTEHQETSSQADRTEQEILYTPAQFAIATQEVDHDLDDIFGPSLSPKFPIAPQFSRKSIDPALIMQSPDLAQAHFYPDPSHHVNQAPVGSFFENAAPFYGAPYQRRQDPRQGVPFNQRNSPQNIPGPSQTSPQGPSQSALLGVKTQTTYGNSQIHPPSQLQKPEPHIPTEYQRPQNAQPQFTRPDSDYESSSDESKSKSRTSSQSGNRGCFEDDKSRELKPDSTYSVEEIEQYLFKHLQNWKPSEYNPKLGGMTLWIQREPNLSYDSWGNSPAIGCRLKCCMQGGKLSAGELRVAFDVQPRNSPSHDPRQNAGYVHLCCLERFLDFPKICIQLNVKGEDRVLGGESLKRNRMILRTAEEVDIVDRFVNFCSSNWRPPASYPAMDMNTHTRPFEGTLVREIEILWKRPYKQNMQRIWETQGRDGVMGERQRENEKKMMMYMRGNHAKTKAPANRGENRAREPKLDSESGSGSAHDNRPKLKRRGKKRARVEEPIKRYRVRKAVRTRNAELKSLSKAMQSKRRSRKRAQEHKPRPRVESVTSTCSSDSSFEPEKRGRKRARESDPAPRSESGPSSDLSLEYPKRTSGRAKKSRPVKLPSRRSDRMQGQEVNDEECEPSGPSKRARRV